MFDSFIAHLHCPACGTDTPDAEIQTYLLRDGAAIRVGFEFGVADLTIENLVGSDYLLLREPDVEGPIRLLDVWFCPACRTEPWAMIEIVDRRVREITAVTLNRTTLLAAHFISGTNANILADSLRADSDGDVDSVGVLKRHLS